MSDRYCPYCGELIRSDAVTCPKCYKKVPPEPEAPKSKSSGHRRSAGTQPQPDQTKQRNGRTYNRRTAMFLNMIPGFFGIVGLGQIYRNHKGLMGYFMVLLGLALFTSSVMLLMHWTPSFLVNLFSSLSAFPMMLLYALLYLFGLLDIVMGQLLHMNPDY